MNTEGRIKKLEEAVKNLEDAKDSIRAAEARTHEATLVRMIKLTGVINALIDEKINVLTNEIHLLRLTE